MKVNGALTEDQEQQFRDGVPLHGRKTSPAELKRIKPGANPWYEVRITEGRQNQIRIMFKHFGRLVEKLRRVKIAFLELDVAPGAVPHADVEGSGAVPENTRARCRRQGRPRQGLKPVNRWTRSALAAGRPAAKPCNSRIRQTSAPESARSSPNGYLDLGDENLAVKTPGDLGLICGLEEEGQRFDQIPSRVLD